MKKILMLGTLGVVLFASSCTVQNRTISSATMEARVNFSSSDLEYVGTVTGTATQYYVLGIPYGNRRMHTATTPMPGAIPTPNIDRAYNNALYDALSQKPDADFVLPLSSESKTDYSFLGKKVTLKVKTKAFKLKEK